MFAMTLQTWWNRIQVQNW